MPMDTSASPELERDLDKLDKNGYIIVRGALDSESVVAFRDWLYRKVEAKEWDGYNKVGNVSFDHLLEQAPELSKPLVGHPSVAPLLKGMLGRQCQLRSLRCHVNPVSYTQEWHRDFVHYWNCEDEGRHALRPLCLNTTFYLTDNDPETGRLTFLKEYAHKELPKEINEARQKVDYENPFHRWCETQEKVDLHPMSGDAVVFFSHIPHQGAKLKQEEASEPTRCNIVLHYQQTPMFWGIPFVSSQRAVLDALGTEASFPFTGKEGK